MTADGNAGPLTILAPGADNSGTLGADAGTVVLDAAGASRVTVPFDALLLTAQYTRDGDDLVLAGDNGETVVIKGYFALGAPPTLVTELGAQVEPTLAYRLANAEPLEQYAQAAGGADLDVAHLNAAPSTGTGFAFSAGPGANDVTVQLSGASSETLVLTEIESVIVTGGAGADSVSFSGSLAGTPVVFVTAFGQNGGDVFDATNAGIAVDFRGGGGNDTLTGDALNDFLGGGPGNDMLTGGGGSDTFGYSSPSDGTAWSGEADASAITADQITDFTTAVDQINLNSLAFDFTSNGPLDATNFVVIAGDYDGTLSGVIPSEYAAENGTVIVDGGGQVIYDGNGAVDGYSVLANVGAGTPVVSTDINVVVPA